MSEEGSCEHVSMLILAFNSEHCCAYVQPYAGTATVHSFLVKEMYYFVLFESTSSGRLSLIYAFDTAEVTNERKAAFTVLKQFHE